MTDSQDPTSWTACEIARRVGKREVSAEEVARAHLERIGKIDGKVRAFIRVFSERALAEARAVDASVSAGKAGRLAGVPVALKDNMMVRGERTTCGSKILEDYTAVYDATVVERLRAEGAVILGKTNMDEFAMGSSTENSAFFPTRNPWNLDRVPGGSSGGSAAAVASGMAPLALGSDTGGSIRQPAAFCGVVGLKPTYGSVSRYGLVAFASSLDQIGPLSRSVADAGLVLSVIAGHDRMDSTSSPGGPRAYLGEETEASMRGIRIGLPREYFGEGLSPEIESSVRAAADAAERRGARIEEVSLPHTRLALCAYYIIAPCEASSNLARFDGVRFGLRQAEADTGLAGLYEGSRGAGFGPEVKRRIMLGTYALSAGYYDAYYLKAQKVRTLIRKDFDEVFRKVDILLTPTTPSSAFRFGEKTDPLQMYLSDVYTLPCNIAGHGGLSMPCGIDKEGLPIGLQLMGRAGEEEVLLRAARVLEGEMPSRGVPA